MRRVNETARFFIVAVLVAANVYIFLQSTATSAKIESYEAGIKKLHLANMDLEKKAYVRGSLEYVASEAAFLNFTAAAQTMVIRTAGVARVPK